jgi:hypothetical protein
LQTPSNEEEDTAAAAAAAANTDSKTTPHWHELLRETCLFTATAVLAAQELREPPVCGRRDAPYVMAQLGHVDPKVMLGIYANVMDRRDGEPERLKALVEGVFRQPLDSKTPNTSPAAPADDARKPVESGILRP